MTCSRYGITITEHALERFNERVLNRSINAVDYYFGNKNKSKRKRIKKHMISKGLASLICCLGDGEYPILGHKGCVIIVKDKTILTTICKD